MNHDEQLSSGFGYRAALYVDIGEVFCLQRAMQRDAHELTDESVCERLQICVTYTADGKMNHDLDYAYPDVWASFAAMAAVTATLRFSSSVYLLPLRNPIEVAKQAGTCALISNNRVTIGFGVGWLKEEFDAMGVDFHTRGKRTDEMIEVMRKLWQGGVVSHHGNLFRFDEVEMRPVPTRPVPFYVGGRSPAALRRAAYRCDGYIGPGHAIDDVPAFMTELNRLRRDPQGDVDASADAARCPLRLSMVSASARPPAAQ